MYTKHKWNSEVFYNFEYVTYLPKDYDENRKYPLVFFLHGAGERGNDLDVACRHGFMKHVREAKKTILLFLLHRSVLTINIGVATPNPYLHF